MRAGAVEQRLVEVRERNAVAGLVGSSRLMLPSSPRNGRAAACTGRPCWGHASRGLAPARARADGAVPAAPPLAPRRHRRDVDRLVGRPGGGAARRQGGHRRSVGRGRPGRDRLVGGGRWPPSPSSSSGSPTPAGTCSRRSPPISRRPAQRPVRAAPAPRRRLPRPVAVGPAAVEGHDRPGDRAPLHRLRRGVLRAHRRAGGGHLRDPAHPPRAAGAAHLRRRGAGHRAVPAVRAPLLRRRPRHPGPDRRPHDHDRGGCPRHPGAQGVRARTGGLRRLRRTVPAPLRHPARPHPAPHPLRVGARHDPEPHPHARAAGRRPGRRVRRADPRRARRLRLLRADARVPARDPGVDHGPRRRGGDRRRARLRGLRHRAAHRRPAGRHRHRRRRRRRRDPLRVGVVPVPGQRAAGAARASTSRSIPARRSPSSARPDAARRRWSPSSLASTTPPPAASPSTATTCATSPSTACAATSGSPSRSRRCSRPRSARTC